MAPNSKTKTTAGTITSVRGLTDDDDFQDAVVSSLPLTQTKLVVSSSSNGGNMRKIKPLKPSNSAVNCPPKNTNQKPLSQGKENLGILAPPVMTTQSPFFHTNNSTIESKDEEELLFSPDIGLDSIESTIDCSFRVENEEKELKPQGDFIYSCNSAESRLLKSSVNCISSVCKNDCTDDDDFYPGRHLDCSFRIHNEDTESKPKGDFSYSCNSIESRLMKSSAICGASVCKTDSTSDDEFQPGTQLDILFRLCSEVDANVESTDTSPIHCPLCGNNISDLNDEQRQAHTNECLDKEEDPNYVNPVDEVTRTECPGVVVDGSPIESPQKAASIDVSHVVQWLRSLGLEKYEQDFVREEIDWESLQWLTEEDLLSIGVTALGPRKKIINSLTHLRIEVTSKKAEKPKDVSKAVVDDTDKLVTNKRITDYFPGHFADSNKLCKTSRGKTKFEKSHSDSGCKSLVVKNQGKNRKLRDVPLWCSIPGTPFRVDAFKYLGRDCSHWFLTHFHIDHYQGLVRSFCHGKIYCSSITAKLVNLKIGIPWDKIQVLPLNEKISIEGINVTCFDANHCPGSIMLLFEPPTGQAVLHTGDFRFIDDMARIFLLQTSRVYTLILDTTYCDPQYDFPKQEAVMQFVIDAIQAEAFNPKTLFLIGSYTIGKERLFLEVARVLRKKVYISAAKLRILECLGLSEEDMQWLTLNEQESHIHVVPMWTLASFKRLKHLCNQYQSRFSLVVAISPTGWSFGKGKKKSPGTRWQQGTIIRYEVPYSEHCSFTELREFVKLVSPVKIIPSVNNDGPESTNRILSLLNST